VTQYVTQTECEPLRSAGTNVQDAVVRDSDRSLDPNQAGRESQRAGHEAGDLDPL